MAGELDSVVAFVRAHAPHLLPASGDVGDAVALAALTAAASDGKVGDMQRQIAGQAAAAFKSKRAFAAVAMLQDATPGGAPPMPPIPAAPPSAAGAALAGSTAGPAGTPTPDPRPALERATSWAREACGETPPTPGIADARAALARAIEARGPVGAVAAEDRLYAILLDAVLERGLVHLCGALLDRREGMIEAIRVDLADMAVAARSDRADAAAGTVTLIPTPGERGDESALDVACGLE